MSKRSRQKPIRVGVIGVGRGMSYAKGATELVGMKLVAICDTWKDRLRDVGRQLGVTTTKQSPDLTMVVHLFSPGGRYDEVYLRNYATLQVKDVLARIPGAGVLLAIPALVVLGLGIFSGNAALLVGCIGLAVIYLIVLGLVQSALQSIFQAVVFLYARDGQVPEGFEAELLGSAMVRK